MEYALTPSLLVDWLLLYFGIQDGNLGIYYEVRH